MGALQYLEEQVGLGHISTFYGSSIGAIISGLLIVGYSPMEMLTYICVEKIMPQMLSAVDISKIITNQCLLDQMILPQLLTDMIMKKLGYIPTLQQLVERFQKRLCVCTIDREHPTTPVYISNENHPDLSMVHAIHMSAAVPFVFGYAKYMDKEYLDGGLLDQFPILEASKTEPHVFGIDLLRAHGKNDTILNEFLDVIHFPITFISNVFKKELRRGKYIEIMTENEHVTKSTIDIIQKYISGYRQCKEQLPVFDKVDEPLKEKKD